MTAYATSVRPLLFQLDPEQIHELAMVGLRWGVPAPVRAFLRPRLSGNEARLGQRLWGLRFTNPVGLGAGFDKDAVAVPQLAAFGFSHLEVGTVTGHAQPGNPRPRCFRLRRDRAVINRMGFNNLGATTMAARLGGAWGPARNPGTRRPPALLGINLGKTKAVALDQALEDYRASVRCLAHLADYLVVNVSSPNTPGLRDLQSETALRPLLAGIRAEVDIIAPRTPLLLKIAPDLAAAGIDAAVDVALECRLDGLIATNTTIARGGLATPRGRVAACGAGGLSGAPLRGPSSRVLARVARRVAGRMPIIGVGGIDDAASAWEKIGLGASLVQVYTGFIYAGPLVVHRICRGLESLLDRHRLQRIDQAVGRLL